MAVLAALLACGDEGGSRAVAPAPASDREATPRAEGPPNIVLVISDDQGWRDYGFMGSDLAKTPNLDSLAASGTVFTHAFSTASACRPSLRTLLTGLEPERINALEQALTEQNVRFPAIAAISSVASLPREFGRAGYVSFQGGKHWEGRYSQTGFDAGTALGYDAARAKRVGLMNELSGGDGIELGRSTMAPLFDFIREHQRDRFFVWFAPMLPHTPHDPPQAFLDLYSDTGLGPAAQGYYGNVTRLDARIGELIALIDELGLREDTLIVFVADNGWQQDPDADWNMAQLGGPHGKFSIGEIGFRSPMIFSWPGSLPAGRRDGTLVSTLDVFPTLLDFAGVRAGGALEPPAGRNGVDLRGLLEGGPAPDREYLIAGMDRLRDDWQLEPGDEAPVPELFATVTDEPGYFLRAAGWRYVWLPGRGLEQLFAIDDDPDERVDVAARNPDRVARYRAAVEAWRARMHEPAAIEWPPRARAVAQPPSSM